MIAQSSASIPALVFNLVVSRRMTAQVAATSKATVVLNVVSPLAFSSMTFETVSMDVHTGGYGARATILSEAEALEDSVPTQ